MAQSPMTKREATYKRGHPKTPIFLYWQLSEDGGDVPRINIENADENDVANPVFEAYDVESVEELDEKLYGDRYASESKRQLGVMVGNGEDRAFFTDTELLQMVDELSDELAAGLIDWFTDIPSLCEEVRRGTFDTVYHDAQVEDREWAEEVAQIDNIEQGMKDASVWQEPENVTPEW